MCSEALSAMCKGLLQSKEHRDNGAWHWKEPTINSSKMQKGHPQHRAFSNERVVDLASGDHGRGKNVASADNCFLHIMDGNGGAWLGQLQVHFKEVLQV